MSLTQAFSYVIRPSRRHDGLMAFINWHNTAGESVLAGTLVGFAQESELRRAADVCAAALSQEFGPWERKGDE